MDMQSKMLKKKKNSIKIFVSLFSQGVTDMSEWLLW